jgi:cell filamentation protein
VKDPYLYPNSNILVNLFDEKDELRFNEIEANYTSLRLRQLVEKPISGKFDFKHLCNIHKFIFQDIYSWSGQHRTINIEKPEAVLGGLSVEYSQVEVIQLHGEKACAKFHETEWAVLNLEQKAEMFAQNMSQLWKVHPFREGNTRTVITFCCSFAEAHHFPLNREIFKDNSVFVRRALVAANAVFHDIGDRSQPQHLSRIVLDAIRQGQEL